MQDYPLILDTSQTGVQQTVTGFYCGDAGEKRLSITLMHQNTLYTPQTGTLALCGIKPDGTRFLHPCTVSGSQVLYLPTAQTLAVPGTVTCQMIVYGRNGSVLFAPQFAIEVDEPLQPQEGLVSADEWTLLPVDVLAGLSVENDALLLDGQYVGAVILAGTFSDLPSGVCGQTAFVQTGDADHARGFYRFGTQWDYLSVTEHTHTNKADLDTLHVENGSLFCGDKMVGALISVSNSRHLPSDSPVGTLAYVNSELSLYRKEQERWIRIFNGMQVHMHPNQSELDKIGEYGGVMTFDGEPVAGQLETLVPLSLGVTYDELFVRPDWQDVPVYIIGDNPVVCRLASDASVNGFAQSEIRLHYLVDYITGMPCPALSVTSGGSYLTYFPVTYHAMGKTLTAGWYDVNDQPVQGTPTFTNMTFDRLVIGSGDPIRNLSGLSGEALCALETLSRMVNVSVDAMGSHGEKPDGVQRLNHAPQAGRRYAAVTNRNITFALPEIAWSGSERDFWLDLSCTSSISLTFSDDVAYEDGNNVDTTRGNHRLHFYVPAGADMWTVAETESYTEITEDFLPDYVIPFAFCTADQIHAVLKLGYSDGNGNWCVRRKGGIIQTWFRIGDMHSVTLTDGQEVKIRIIGIDHDELPNGGKAALTCDFVEAVSIPETDVSVGNYAASPYRTSVTNLYELLPEWLRSMVVKAKKVIGNDYIQDHVWAFSVTEIGKTYSDVVEGTPYPYYTDASSRRHKDENENNVKCFLRTLGLYGRLSYLSTYDGIEFAEYAGLKYDFAVIGFCIHVD